MAQDRSGLTLLGEKLGSNGQLLNVLHSRDLGLRAMAHNNAISARSNESPIGQRQRMESPNQEGEKFTVTLPEGVDIGFNNITSYFPCYFATSELAS